nr:D-2-hydroxyacid dehydrogenase [uncultured Cellulosilyticum sp.]
MKICILDARTLGSDIDISKLHTLGELTVYETTRPEEVAERVKDAEIILTNKVVLNESNLKDAQSVKMIGLLATGYNNVDTAYASERGICVCNVAGYSTKSVAQHTFSMLFYLISHMAKYDHYVKSKEYAGSEIFTNLEWPFWEIANKTFGIIGLGAIGREVAKIATAFGANVVYYSTSGKNNNPEYTQVDLETLLTTSDVVAVHAPFNEKTNGLINYDALKLMKKTAILINVGRGKIVVESDLARALNEGEIAGAALDVLEKEPIEAMNPLYSVEDPSKLIITPHIAWASVEARKTLVEEVAKNIQSYQAGEPRNKVN